MLHFVKILTSCFLLIFISCKEDENNADDSKTDPITILNTKPNILLIIADDMGKDATSGFNEGSTKPFTPTLDSIRNSGLSFDNFWVSPTCSPTRSTILTGKYGYRTGVRAAGGILANDETSLQTFISSETNNAYSSAIVGKWHLSGNSTRVNPEDFGIDYYAGLIIGAAPDYYNWSITEDGVTNDETEYITSKIAQLGIDWKKDQTKPWFLWTAFTAPHTPFHAPPEGTHSQGSLIPFTNGMPQLPYYMAAIESMDYEINRLLSSISQAKRENLVIIFIGDNGSPNPVAQSPYSRTKAKGSLYQGGINTPLFISGKGVTRSGTDTNLVSSVDLFCTIANIAGSSTTQRNDSKSFYSLLSNNGTHRDFVYSEIDDGSDENYTIRNNRYKLIVFPSTIEMYDLQVDPYENTNLISGTLTSAEESAKAELEAELVLIRN